MPTVVYMGLYSKDNRVFIAEGGTYWHLYIKIKMYILKEYNKNPDLAVWASKVLARVQNCFLKKFTVLSLTCCLCPGWCKEEEKVL